MTSEDRQFIRDRWTLIALYAGILVLASVLAVTPGERVCMPSLANLPLPELCMTKGLWGVDCPGCGLTRSLICLGHGDLWASLQYHRLGPVFYLFVWFQLLHQCTKLRRRQKDLSAPMSRWVAWAGNVLIAAFVVNWFCGLLLAV